MTPEEMGKISEGDRLIVRGKHSNMQSELIAIAVGQEESSETVKAPWVIVGRTEGVAKVLTDGDMVVVDGEPTEMDVLTPGQKVTVDGARYLVHEVRGATSDAGNEQAILLPEDTRHRYQWEILTATDAGRLTRVDGAANA